MKTKTYLVLFFLAVVCVSVQADWYPGIIHAHSTFSDGTRNPESLIEKAKKSSALFLIPTDHYEQIGKEKKFGGTIADDFGFDNYRKRFTTTDLVVISGAEVTKTSHTLAIGDIKYDGILMNAKTQQEVIGRIKELGWLSVAAHPGSKKYPYDTNAADGICGIEFFNDGSEEGYKKTRDLYLSLLKQGKDVFVTAGCDSHYPIDPQDSARWQRKTWVFCDKLDKTSIFEAFARSQTYASSNNIKLENFDYIPGFLIKRINYPEFAFTVSFEKKTSSSKVVKIYRDGELVSDSAREYPKGLEKIDYSWQDQVLLGEHRYVIEVEGVLITSPIRLEFPALTDLGKILFCLEDEKGQVALWTINPDGSGLRKWMDWNNKWSRPSFSPSGKEMIFEDYGNNSVWIFNTQDRKKQKAPLDNNQNICEPSWSLQNKIVFVYRQYYQSGPNNSLGGTIKTVDPDGQNLKELFSLGDAKKLVDADIAMPRWSFDGNYISFSGICDLCVVDAKGSNLQRLTNDYPQWVGQGPFLWSPKGDLIGILSNVNTPDNKWHEFQVIRPNGKDRKTIISDLRYMYDWDWSKTGSEIVLSTSPADSFSDIAAYKLIMVDFANPKQKRIVFQKENCKIHFVMWNSFIESK